MVVDLIDSLAQFVSRDILVVGSGVRGLDPVEQACRQRLRMCFDQMNESIEHHHWNPPRFSTKLGLLWIGSRVRTVILATGGGDEHHNPTAFMAVLTTRPALLGPAI